MKSELAALSEVCSQYVPLLELGLVGDVEATLAEFNDKCETAGLAYKRNLSPSMRNI